MCTQNHPICQGINAVKMFQFRNLSTLLLVFFCIQFTHAQERSRVEQENRAVKAIQDLKDGVLILRLPSNAKKIKAMEDLLASDISAKDKARVKKQIESIRTKNKEENAAFAAAFGQHFTFSPVYIIYDTTTTALLAGEEGNYLLNPQLQPVPSGEIRDKSFLIARLGRTDRSNTSGAEAIVLMDQNLQDLSNPFPYAAKLNSLGYALNRILIPEVAFDKRLAKVVTKLDRSLKRFYSRLSD